MFKFSVYYYVVIVIIGNHVPRLFSILLPQLKLDCLRFSPGDFLLVLDFLQP